MDSSTVKRQHAPVHRNRVEPRQISRRHREQRDTPAHASPMPITPPAAPISRLSVRSCRTSRPRPAPIAARSAISRSRTDARASSRFATFVHAISSTQATAPSSTRIAGRIRPTDLLAVAGDVDAVAFLPGKPLEDAGVDALEVRLRLLDRHAGLHAADDLEPQRSAVRPLLLRDAPVGTQNSVSRLGNANPSGMTPMMRIARPFISSVLPIASSRPPKRRCHRPCDRTTTLLAPGLSSSTV